MPSKFQGNGSQWGYRQVAGVSGLLTGTAACFVEKFTIHIKTDLETGNYPGLHLSLSARNHPNIILKGAVCRQAIRRRFRNLPG